MRRGYYCAFVVFDSSEEADQAFENVDGNQATVFYNLCFICKGSGNYLIESNEISLSVMFFFFPGFIGFATQTGCF